MNDDLKQQLQCWKVEPDIPTTFQAEVWAKITAKEVSKEKSIWNRWMLRLSQIITQPVYASAIAMAILTISLTGAYTQSQRANIANLAELQSRYAASIDPASHRIQY